MTTPPSPADDIAAFRSKYGQSRAPSVPTPSEAPNSAHEEAVPPPRDPSRPLEVGGSQAVDPRWDTSAAPEPPPQRPTLRDPRDEAAPQGAPPPRIGSQVSPEYLAAARSSAQAPQAPRYQHPQETRSPQYPTYPQGNQYPPHYPQGQRPQAGPHQAPAAPASDDFSLSSRRVDEIVSVDDSYTSRAKQALPSTGWRKFAAHTLHLPVGKSAKELETDGWVSIMQRPLLGSKVIGFLGGKGGVGKTSMAVAVASMLAIYRSKSVCVVTLDYNSTLEMRTKSREGAARPGVNLHEFAVDQGIQGPQDVAACMDSNVHRLHVLGTGLNPLKPNALTPDQFNSAISKLTRDFELVFLDFGNSPTDVYWQAIASLDEMVLVSSTESDSMSAARAVESQVREAGLSDLVDMYTVGIINHRSSADPLADLSKYSSHRGSLNRREVVEVPWDSHLSESGPVNLELVDKTTYRQIMLASAVVMRTLPS